MTNRLIHTPQDLRPGDLFLGPIGGLVGLGVGLGLDILGEGFKAGTLSIRHAGIIVVAGRTLPPMSIYRDRLYETGVQTAPKLAQAMPGGSEIVDLKADSHWTEKCAYVRLPEDYPGQAEDAAFVARLMVQAGVGYGWLSYSALAAYKFGIRNERLRNWINRRLSPISAELPSTRSAPMPVRKDLCLPREAICSVFDDQAWSLVGKDLVDDTHPQAVTPGKLADVLSDLDGAIWARPRGIGLPARTWQVDGHIDVE